MGEARRKQDDDACGRPRARDPWCPSCRSMRVHVLPREAFAALNLATAIDCDWHGCLDCRAVWEPFPQAYARDPVAAEPCDNCAFRPGSPEQRDPERWAELMASLKQGYWQSRFYCHKGVPIDLAKGPGNYLFARTAILIDGVPLIVDGVEQTIEDVRKMRTCSGFLRMTWARARKERAQDE